MPPPSSRRRHRRKRLGDDAVEEGEGDAKSASAAGTQTAQKKAVAPKIAAVFIEDDDDDLMSFSAPKTQRARGTKRGRGFGTPSAAAIAATSALQSEDTKDDKPDSVQYSAAHLAGLRASQMVLGATDGPSAGAGENDAAGQGDPPPAQGSAAARRPIVPKDEPWLATDGAEDSPLAAQHQAAGVLAAAVAGTSAPRLPPRGTAPFAAARTALDAVPKYFASAIAASNGHVSQAQAQLAHFHVTAKHLQQEDKANQALLGSMAAAFDSISDAHRRMQCAVAIARAAAVLLLHVQSTAGSLKAAYRDAALAASTQPRADEAAVAASLQMMSNGAVPVSGPWQVVFEHGTPSSPAPTPPHLDGPATQTLAQACRGEVDLVHGLAAAAAVLEGAVAASSQQALSAPRLAEVAATCANRFPQLKADILAATSLDRALLALRVQVDSDIASADSSTGEPLGVTQVADAPDTLVQCALRFKQQNPRAYHDTYCSMTMGSLLHPVLLLHSLCGSQGIAELTAARQTVDHLQHCAAGQHGHSGTVDEANDDSTLSVRAVLSAQVRAAEGWLNHSWLPVSASSTHAAGTALQGVIGGIQGLSAAVSSVAPFSSSRDALLQRLSAGVLGGAQAALGQLHVRVALPQARVQHGAGAAVCTPSTLAGVGAQLQLLRGTAFLDGLFPQAQLQLRTLCTEQVLGDQLLAIITAYAHFSVSMDASAGMAPVAAGVTVQLAQQAAAALPDSWWGDASCTEDWSMALTAIGEELLSQCSGVLVHLRGKPAALQSAKQLAAALTARSPQLAANMYKDIEQLE